MDRVVFKMEGTAPLAVFPDTARDTPDGRLVMTYARLGQHCEASEEYVAGLEDATEEDAAPLAAELVSLGYEIGKENAR